MSADTDIVSARPATAGEAPARFSVSISTALAAGIGVLVTVAVATVLGIGIWSARENTLDLLEDKADLMLTLLTKQVSQYMQPPQSQLEFLAHDIEDGTIRPENKSSFGKVLYGAMAAAPQIQALVFVDTDYQMIRVERETDGVRLFSEDMSGDESGRAFVEKSREVGKIFWGAPIWRAQLKQTVINVRQPVFRDGQYIGLLAAGISINDLSTFLGDLGTDVGDNAFILYGRDRVLAHPSLVWDQSGRTVGEPLAQLVGFGDVVLASIWDKRDRRKPLVSFEPPVQNHNIKIGGEVYVFVYRELAGFSDKPWILGSYFHAEDIGQQVDRLSWAIVAGVVALCLSIGISVVLGLRIASPVARLSRAATQIRRLELDQAGALPRSRIRELDDQATSFNAMVGALGWFETYVPKKLVSRLMHAGAAGAVASEARQVTVMFTDIAGFSTISENEPAEKVANFLNEHFALLAACIEAEDGTVDKFMGDAIMAFWGAPDKQKNRAIRACRAALAMAEAVKKDNEARRQAGKAAVGVRVGIHSGPVIVGNIGAPGRLNYTIIGDTVNIGQRLEQLSKQVYDEPPEVAILISAATAADLDDSFHPVSVGFHQLKGRDEKVEVFRLT